MAASALDIGGWKERGVEELFRGFDREEFRFWLERVREEFVCFVFPSHNLACDDDSIGTGEPLVLDIGWAAAAPS